MRPFPEMQLRGIEGFLSPVGVKKVCRASVVFCCAL